MEERQISRVYNRKGRYKERGYMRSEEKLSSTEVWALTEVSG